MSVIPCQLLPATRRTIEEFAEALKSEAYNIGAHGMSEDEFALSGLFGAAIERLRGQQAAATKTKYKFASTVLQFLQDGGYIASFRFAGGGERHDYEVTFADGYKVAVETKGCLDGNNTNIYLRPPSADEFIIWSLCQNPGADPRKNAWSGIHTRLGAEIIHRRDLVDALIIWDGLCGTRGRPCPKLAVDPVKSTVLPSGHIAPPPCIYLFPRTVPDARNNPSPPTHKLGDVRFAQALYDAFKGDANDVNYVAIDVRMVEASVQRRTVVTREEIVAMSSDWTELKRAR